MKVKEESEKVGLKLNIQKTKIMVWPHHFTGNRWRNSGNSVRLYPLDSKITADGDCSHEIKRRLLLGRKVMTNLDSILEKAMAPHYSVLARTIPGTAEPGGLQSTGSQRVGRD